jgi:7-carboxy-7-deazaguanine synthase
LDLISLSPKFSNSVPVVGATTPNGSIVDERMVKTHNRLRLNKEAIRKTLDYHKDYHFKPVWDGTEENLNEIEEFRIGMDIPKHKTYIMPAGDTRETLKCVRKKDTI